MFFTSSTSSSVKVLFVPMPPKKDDEALSVAITYDDTRHTL